MWAHPPTSLTLFPVRSKGFIKWVMQSVVQRTQTSYHGPRFTVAEVKIFSGKQQMIHPVPGTFRWVMEHLVSLTLLAQRHTMERKPRTRAGSRLPPHWTILRFAPFETLVLLWPMSAFKYISALNILRPVGTCSKRSEGYTPPYHLYIC